MSTSSSIEELVRRWKEGQRSGQTPSPEELCNGNPDLLEAFKSWLAERGKTDASRLTTDARETSPLPDYPRPPEVIAGAPDIPGYDFLSVVKIGGQGIVYKVRKHTLARTEALKLLPGDQEVREEVVKRFLQEARAMALLGSDNPNIVPVYHVSDPAKPPYYFTMKFAVGGDVGRQIKRFQADPRRTAVLMECVARAVAHAHAHGVLHRDLKPGNILLDEHDEPLVTDFGLAKLISADQDLTRTRVVLGTVPYMAPEQTRIGPLPVTAATDIWALGVVLYELLTGKRPFAADTDRELFRKIRDHDPEPPSSISEQVPHPLEIICLKCLRKAPTERYASARDLADDLRLWLKGEPIKAEPEPWTQRFKRMTRRHWIATTAAAVGAVAAVAVPIGLHVFNPRRRLNGLLARLRGGEAVNLLGDNGRPVWHEWYINPGNERGMLTEQGVFSIHSGSLSLLALLPDPQIEHYRFRAEVRHDPRPSLRQGEVGLFFGYGYVKIPPYEDHHFARWRFSEVPMKGHEAKEPLGYVRGDLSHYCRQGPQSGNHGLIGSMHKKILPAEFDFTPDPWRRLAIEMTPEYVRWFCNDPEPAGELTRKQIRDAGAGAAVSRGDWGHLAGVCPPRGALGLYLDNASASFREVWVEPLPG